MEVYSGTVGAPTKSDNVSCPRNKRSWWTTDAGVAEASRTRSTDLGGKEGSARRANGEPSTRWQAGDTSSAPVGRPANHERLLRLVSLRTLR